MSTLTVQTLDNDEITIPTDASFAVRWWTAADNNNTGIILIDGPLDAAHLALARDTADSEQLQTHGSHGFCAHEVIVVDGDEQLFAIGDDVENYDVSSTGATSAMNGWDDLPIVDADCIEFSDGELDMDDISDIEGTHWDGNNHVQFIATRSRGYISDTRRVSVDGRVTWIFDDCDGDGYEGLVDVEIADGWSQIDYYATNGYGNESSAFHIESDMDGRHPDRSIEAALYDASIPFEFSSINDGCSNEQAYAAILIVPSECVDNAISALQSI